MKNPRIAYQGSVGSFSERAAARLAEMGQLATHRLLPMMGSEKVCAALEAGEADYGVVALENSIGGAVAETRRAFATRRIESLLELTLPIHHCLYAHPTAAANAPILRVASHEQALMQCRETLKRMFGDIQTLRVADTALAAKRLSDGSYDQNTAVLCAKRAGALLGLTLLGENLEDRSDNRTRFCLFRLAL